MKDLPPPDQCSSPEEFFYTSLKSGKTKSPEFLLLRNQFPQAYDRASKRFDDEQRRVEAITGKPAKEDDWWGL
jgi:hypothetical protein